MIFELECDWCQFKGRVADFILVEEDYEYEVYRCPKCGHDFEIDGV